MNRYILIEQPADFDDLIEDLSDTGYIAIDTESNSFHAYYERICLIQISTSERDYIVDPLALKDLSPLGKVLADPASQKIFHAASNDILGLKRDFQFYVANLFDTAIACKLLGYTHLGLAKILEEQFEVKLNKKWQRCDWGRRPLQEDQLAYAQLDTHYLIALRHRLAAVLEARGLAEKAREAFAKACEQENQEKTFHPGNFIQIRGARALDPIGQCVLKALYVYRENEARRRDRAPFRILSNETLLRLAQTRPTTVQQFAKTKGVPQSYRRGRGASHLLELIRKIQQTEEAIRAQQE